MTRVHVVRLTSGDHRCLGILLRCGQIRTDTGLSIDCIVWLLCVEIKLGTFIVLVLLHDARCKRTNLDTLTVKRVLDRYLHQWLRGLSLAGHHVVLRR